MNILRKLTLKNLKLNKTRTIVTIIGIMLSTVLIMSVAGITTSMQQTMIADQINYTGDHDIYLSDTNLNLIEEINANRDIQEVYVQSELGCAVAPNAESEYRPYINVVGLTKNSFESGFNFTLEDGRLPENGNEVILTPDALMNYDPNIKVGDKITLDLGTRVASNGKTLSDFDEYAPFVYGEYDEQGNLLFDITESVENTQPKTYTVVGIIKYCSDMAVSEMWSACSSIITIKDDYSNAKNINAFINIKPESEKDFLAVTEHITGLSKDSTKKLWDTNNFYYDFSMKENSALQQEIEDNENFSNIIVNSLLMDYKGYGVSESSMKGVYLLVVFVALVIVFASAFIIRNSFAISITEKTKLYGKLISVGATPKQIKRNVLFEGVILGVIGVFLGLVLGAGVVALLVWLMNLLLSDFLYGSVFVYSLPWWVPFFTMGMAALVIFFSTYAAADCASKIAPVVAIRENSYVKISKKQRKYKTPAYIKKLFGVGGDIAYKNLKRSKKKYRTTVVSIIVSISIFITISSFVDYGMLYSKNMFGNISHNFEVYGLTEEQGDVIKNLDGVSDVITIKENHNTDVKGFKGFTAEYIARDEFYDPTDPYYTGDTYYLSSYVLNDAFFKDFVEVYGFDYDQVKDKVIVCNFMEYMGQDENIYTQKVYRIDEDAKLDIIIKSDSMEDDSKENNSTAIEVIGADFGGEILERDTTFEDVVPLYNSLLIVSESWCEKNNVDLSLFYTRMYMNCEDPNKVQETITELDYYGVDCMNYQEFIDQNNNFILILSIFAYGFIAIISLIGVTNIFNTVTTNMNLRRKDFAILRSVGMTQKEFSRMIKLETLFYGAKALVIGLPLGIAGTVLVYMSYIELHGFGFNYNFPWLAVALSIVCVFALLWSIMKYSFSKIKKQNIIETIRNDNI